jgi:hypothetical protein
MRRRDLQLKNRLARLESGLGPITPFGGGRATWQFLAAFKGDAAGMGVLRRLLRDSGRRLDVYRLTEDQVLEETALLISMGEIELGIGRTWAIGASSAVDSGSKVADVPAAPVRTGQSTEPEPPTFSPSQDGAAQAATLAAAAASGIPFCAQCAKAAAAGAGTQ